MSGTPPQGCWMSRILEECLCVVEGPTVVVKPNSDKCVGREREKVAKGDAACLPVCCTRAPCTDAPHGLDAIHVDGDRGVWVCEEDGARERVQPWSGNAKLRPALTEEKVVGRRVGALMLPSHAGRAACSRAQPARCPKPPSELVLGPKWLEQRRLREQVLVQRVREHGQFSPDALDVSGERLRVLSRTCRRGGRRIIHLWARCPCVRCFSNLRASIDRAVSGCTKAAVDASSSATSCAPRASLMPWAQHAASHSETPSVRSAPVPELAHAAARCSSGEAAIRTRRPSARHSNTSTSPCRWHVLAMSSSTTLKEGLVSKSARSLDSISLVLRSPSSLWRSDSRSALPTASSARTSRAAFQSLSLCRRTLQGGRVTAASKRRRASQRFHLLAQCVGGGAQGFFGGPARELRAKAIQGLQHLGLCRLALQLALHAHEFPAKPFEAVEHLGLCSLALQLALQTRAVASLPHPARPPAPPYPAARAAALPRRPSHPFAQPCP
eukprot:scaffold213814_cov27-Tisochrysis_lutea.AAC.1